MSLDGHPDDPVDRVLYEDEAQTRAYAEPTAAGRALEAKYGRKRWIRREGIPRTPTAED